MSKSKLQEILEAMLCASGMGPIWDDDYYEDSNAQTRANFINGLVLQFGIDNAHYLFHHNNSQWLDTPSETVAFWVERKDLLLADG